MCRLVIGRRKILSAWNLVVPQALPYPGHSRPSMYDALLILLFFLLYLFHVRIYGEFDESGGRITLALWRRDFRDF